MKMVNLSNYCLIKTGRPSLQLFIFNPHSNVKLAVALYKRSFNILVELQKLETYVKLIQRF